MSEVHHFLTVEWCKEGRRGIFCNSDGVGFWELEPQTQAEMQEILGVFWLILSPESTPLTKSQAAEYTHWLPLAEYSDQFGIAMKPEDVAFLKREP